MVRMLRCAALALSFALPATAQTYGPQPGLQPAPYQAPAQPGPSMVGTWSGQSTGPNGTIQQAESYTPDGRFVTVARLENGFLSRFWGVYRATQVGPNQLRLETRLEGWLPREICQQQAGGQPQCQPVQIPTSDTSLLTFGSPDRFQSMSETSAGPLLSESRDDQPSLLQAQAPQRWTTITQPAPSAPVGVRPGPYVGPTRTPQRCNNDDTQIAICKYSGTLVVTNGCLRCVGG